MYNKDDTNTIAIPWCATPSLTGTPCVIIYIPRHIYKPNTPILIYIALYNIGLVKADYENKATLNIIYTYTKLLWINYTVEQFSNKFLIPRLLLHKSFGINEDPIKGHVLNTFPASIPATVTPVSIFNIDVCNIAVAII